MKATHKDRKVASRCLLFIVSLSVVFYFTSCSNDTLAPDDPGGMVRLDPSHEYFSQFIEADAGGTIELADKIKLKIPDGSLVCDTEIYGWVHTDIYMVEFEFYPEGTMFSPPATIKLNWSVLSDIVEGNTDTDGLTAKVKPDKWKCDQSKEDKKIKVNLIGENAERIDPSTVQLNWELDPVETKMKTDNKFEAKFNYIDAFELLENPVDGECSLIKITGNYIDGSEFMLSRGIEVKCSGDDDDDDDEGDDDDDEVLSEDEAFLQYFDEDQGDWLMVEGIDYGVLKKGDWLKIDIEHFSRYAVTTHNTNSGDPQ